MFKKLSRCLLLCTVLSVIVACECVCPPPITYTKKHKSIDLKTFDISGFESRKIQDSVFKNAFGMVVAVRYDLEELSEKSTLKRTSSGFGDGVTTCDCVLDQYVVGDSLRQIDLWVKDVKTQAETKVTDKFRIAYDKDLTISEYISKATETWALDHVHIELRDGKTIPNTSIFKAIATFKSGKSLTKQTDTIRFK